MKGFHHIRLELAREPGHPHGDSRDGWDLVAALDDDGRLDLEACRAEPKRCFVRRFVRDATIAKGHLRHSFGDRWILDMEGHDELDASSFRPDEERFALGDYVSIVSSDGKAHTYGVERLQRLEPDAKPVQAAG
jgi:hypothetical protein